MAWRTFYDAYFDRLWRYLLVVAVGNEDTAREIEESGIETVKIPPGCPRANCHAERFVPTARSELTDRMLILSQRHLDTALAEHVRHYNGRRPHRSRELRPPRPTYPVANLDSQRIERQQVLGGLINEYERAA